MSNQFVSTVNTLAKVIIALQKNETVFFGSANKDYEGQYEKTAYTLGSTVNVMLPFYPKLQNTIEIKPTPIIDRTRPVKCEEIFSVGVEVNNVDLSLGLKSFVDKHLINFYEVIKCGTERFLIEKMIAGSTFIPITTVSALKTTPPLKWLTAARTMMSHMKMNTFGSLMVLNNHVANDVRGPLSKSSLSSDKISQSVIRRGLTGQISGVPVHESSDLMHHTAGQLAKVPTLNLRVKAITKSPDGLYITGITFSAYKDKARKTPISDISANAVKKYDAFVFNDIGWKQAITDENTIYLTFCRSAVDVHSIMGGGFSITLAQPLEIAKLSRLPIPDDAVTALDDHTNNFLYSRNGLSAVNPPLGELADVKNKTVRSDGISCYAGYQGDITRFTQMYRISTLLGSTVFEQNVIAMPIPTNTTPSQTSNADLMGAFEKSMVKYIKNASTGA